MENETHAFIIRVWYEAQDSEGKVLTWRGSIDHVGGNKRLYFQDMSGVVKFIQEQSGIYRNRKANLWRSIMVWIRDGFNKLQHIIRNVSL